MVIIRMRSYSELEKKQDKSSAVESYDTENNSIQIKKENNRMNWKFDNVLKTNISKSERCVWKDCKRCGWCIIIELNYFNLVNSF